MGDEERCVLSDCTLPDPPEERPHVPVGQAIAQEQEARPPEPFGDGNWQEGDEVGQGEVVDVVVLGDDEAVARFVAADDGPVDLQDRGPALEEDDVAPVELEAIVLRLLDLQGSPPPGRWRNRVFLSPSASK
jgi:hypothetical protein